MFESLLDDHRRARGSKQKPIRLFLEELERRCLLANQLSASAVAIETNPASVVFAPNPNQQVTDSWVPPSASNITLGADGNLWFWVREVGAVGQLNPATGIIRLFTLPSGSTADSSIIAGPDGNLWLLGNEHLDQLNPTTGTVQVLPLPAGVMTFTNWNTLFGVGPDGEIWFSCMAPGQLGQTIEEMDPATGIVKEVEIAQAGQGFPIKDTGTVDANGSTWILGFDSNQTCYLGQKPPSSSSVNSVIELPGVWADGIAQTSDGMLWFRYDCFVWQGVEEFDPATGTVQIFKVPSQTVVPPTGSTISNNSISAAGTSISATAGINFTTAVATLTPQTPIPATGAAYQATIDWGDGTTSSLELTVSNNATYDLTAGHSYQTAGTYSIKVTIGNFDPANHLGDNPVTVFSTANVNDPLNVTM